MAKSGFLVAVCAIATVPNASSFSIKEPRSITSLKSTFNPPQPSFSADLDLPLDKAACRNERLQTLACGTLATASLASFSFMNMAAAAADDVEIAELPPVYVPILFAIGVLGGVGVLTASLGDVMDEGAFVVLM